MTRLATGAVVSLALVAVGAPGQEYPARAIRIVTSPAGGGNDFQARIVARGISTPLGQQVVVDNRGGANGIIGADAAAKAAPDGYTLLLGTVSTLAISPSAYATPPYDPMKAFAPVSLLTNAYFTIGANAETMPPTLQAFIAQAKAIVDDEKTLRRLWRLNELHHGLSREIHHRFRQNERYFFTFIHSFAHERICCFIKDER